MSLFGRDDSKNDKGKSAAERDNASVSAAAATSVQPTPQPTRSVAMIGQSIKIKGTVEGNENLVIEGTVEGSVSLPDNDLTIGENGQVTADLNAKNITVQGTVNGDIAGSEKVVISKSGRVRGNITAPRVTLEDGAKFKGSIDMDPGETAKPAPKAETKPTPAPDKQAAS